MHFGRPNIRNFLPEAQGLGEASRGKLEKFTLFEKYYKASLRQLSAGFSRLGKSIFKSFFSKIALIYFLGILFFIF